MQIHTVVNCTHSAESYRCQLYWQRRIVPLSTVLTVQIHTVVNCTHSAESYRCQLYCKCCGNLPTIVFSVEIHTGNCASSPDSYRCQLYWQCRIIPLSAVLPVMNLTENSTSSGDSYRQLYCHWRFILATVLPVKIRTRICAASEEALRMSLLSLHGCSVNFNCWASV